MASAAVEVESLVVGDTPLDRATIAHGILRGGRRPCARRDRARGAAWAMRPIDPRVHGFLWLDPPRGAWESLAALWRARPIVVDEFLDDACRHWLDRTVNLQRGVLALPRELRTYAADFAGHRGVTDFLGRYLPPDERFRRAMGFE